MADICPSVSFVSALHQALYFPSGWSTFASGGFYEFYQSVTNTTSSNLTLATRSMKAQPWSKRQQPSDQDFPNYSFQAISCGDSIDQSDVTTQSVFDEFIRVVENVSPMCK